MALPSLRTLILDEVSLESLEAYYIAKSEAATLRLSSPL